MNTLSYVMPQFPYFAPMLLVYLVGVVLSSVYLKRLAKPAAFALVGCGILFLITAAFPFIQGYIFVSGLESEWASNELERWWMIVGIIRTLLHVTAFSLLLAAIFVGRKLSARSEYVMDAARFEFESDSSRQPHRATLVFVLGILSLIVCAPLGLMAWYMGSNDIAAMRLGHMDCSGESLTDVGRLLGIIATALFVLSLVGLLLWLTVVAAIAP